MAKSVLRTYKVLMRTSSGVELRYTPTTGKYTSEDMDAIISALREDMRSNDPIAAHLAADLFAKLKHAEVSNAC
jgi:hypothetical protein